MTAPSASASLERLQAMLQPDGYDLVVEDESDSVVNLRVVAGEEACEDCLVPKEIFEQIVSNELAPVGLRLGRLEYPEGSGGH